MSADKTEDPFGVVAGTEVLQSGHFPEGDVERLARLARLILSDTLRKDMEGRNFVFVADWFNEIKNIDTKDIDPMISPGVEQARLRTDKVSDGDVQKELMENAPAAQHGFFLVPKVME